MGRVNTNPQNDAHPDARNILGVSPWQEFDGTWDIIKHGWRILAHPVILQFTNPTPEDVLGGAISQSLINAVLSEGPKNVSIEIRADRKLGFPITIESSEALPEYRVAPLRIRGNELHEIIMDFFQAHPNGEGLKTVHDAAKWFKERKHTVEKRDWR